MPVDCQSIYRLAIHSILAVEVERPALHAERTHYTGAFHQQFSFKVAYNVETRSERVLSCPAGSAGRCRPLQPPPRPQQPPR